MTSYSFRTNPRGALALAGVLAVLFLAGPLRADEPYARTRDYDLQHSKIVLRFDIDQKEVFGDVTHTLSILRDDTTRLAFDSVGLNIHSVSLNKAAVKFETTSTKLIVPLASAAHAGEKFDVEIIYDAKPSKGLYFILPDKAYPDRPRQIWTQGESEDTRYYLPTYDYPNDRLTTETIVTVPAAWITVANGKLINVSDAGSGLKRWTWRESLPSSTYLITVVAGEFDEAKQSWRNIPVDYYAPKDRGDRLRVNYGRTPQMIDLFSKTIGVDYPWEKYAQSMVDDFVAGGMENSSATTNTASSLRDSKLVPEFPGDEDDLISHELAHQWFGDLVTCKDWGNIWLNEGFATFFETVWNESYYPKELSDYNRWTEARRWFADGDLYSKPIVRFDFDDSSEFDGNAYTKGGWVLYMLRQQLGNDAFFRSLKHYLEVNRGKNVVTADLVKAIEETTHVDVDRFFNQWVYGAGAPKFDIGYTYDDAKHQVALSVKQTQTIEGQVGLFQVPVQVEIDTPSGATFHNIVVSKQSETFPLKSDAAPLMVLFDKGGNVLKTADFHKEKKEWLYQLKNASELSDRADAAVALGKIKNDESVVAALGEALDTDKAWGVRNIAADTLGHIDTPASARQLLHALTTNNQPWVRARIATALGNFKDEPSVAARLDALAREDASYRARASALESLGHLKTPTAFSTLTSAVNEDSPDGFLRRAALRGFGYLGDDRAVPTLRDWAAPGKPTNARDAAIGSLARLDKGNKDITRQIASYLSESHFEVRIAAIMALGERGDSSAIAALESTLKSPDLSIEMAPMIKEQIARLEKSSSGKRDAHADPHSTTADTDGPDNQAAVTQRLDKLERLVQEMNERLKSIESHLASAKK